MHFEPLGDQAVMACCDHETQATQLAARVRAAAPAWCVDIVQAYVTVAIYYELTAIDYATVASCLAGLADLTSEPSPGTHHLIPVCYELGLDFERIEKHTGLSRDEIVRLHSSSTYTVYAIGFCPGFPYLGYLPDELARVPRLDSPRLKVEAGSVGLTGRQTGIYTEARPGGWNILGRTPLKLVDVADEYFPLMTGDTVQFRRIDEVEFNLLRGKRLRAPTSVGP